MNPSAANVIDNAPESRSVPQIGRPLITFAAAAAVALALTAGCSAGHTAGQPAAKPSDEVQAVTLTATDAFRFTPTITTVHTGRVRITLTENGSYPHNISFPGLNTTSSSISGSPGQTSTSLLLTVNTPGHYGFVCTYHSSAGMKGDLVVLKRP